MTAPVFVDSNVFAPRTGQRGSFKQRAAQQWRAVLWKSRMGRVSFQEGARSAKPAGRERVAALDHAEPAVAAPDVYGLGNLR